MDMGHNVGARGIEDEDAELSWCLVLAKNGCIAGNMTIPARGHSTMNKEYTGKTF